MQLYKAYSLVPSTRLLGDHTEEDIRIDWICHMRDIPIPCRTVVDKFEILKDQAELTGDDEYLRWIQQRCNNLLRKEEVEELTRYLNEKYEFPLYVETMPIPIPARDLPWFKEDFVYSMIVLSGRDDPFTLSTCIVGMVSPYRNMNNVNTVNEFLREVEMQRKHKFQENEEESDSDS